MFSEGPRFDQLVHTVNGQITGYQATEASCRGDTHSMGTYNLGIS